MAAGIVIGRRVDPDLLKRAEEFRKNPTPAEAALWKELRANGARFHFRRQQIISGFIVDFYCHEVSLVVEVDGDVHDVRVEADQEREAVLRGHGLDIIRFRNEVVLAHPGTTALHIHDICFAKRQSGAHRPRTEIADSDAA
jgi:very-short-patch-repair endonuclease